MADGRLKGWMLAAVLLLGGCQLAFPGAKSSADASAGGLAGPAVTVSSLPAVPGQTLSPAKPATAPIAESKPAAVPAMPAAAVANPADPKPAASAAVPETAAAPKPTLSPEGLACEKRGGLWSATGKSGVMACVKRTRDFGKSCSRDRECEGACLARSRSCAPITPLFGCHDVLQDDGRQVTLCLD